MNLLLSIWLALVGLAVGQQFRYWSDASCLVRPKYREIFPEAQTIACQALESLKTISNPGAAIPDSDMRRVFEMLFNTHINDQTLYGATEQWQQRFQRNTYTTPYQWLEDTLTNLCQEWIELEQGRNKKDAGILIYCDENAGNVQHDGWYYDMENGIRGKTSCQENAFGGETQAHTWHSTLVGPQWARWNPDRVRMTLCEEILNPIRIYKDGEADIRDLQEFELGGQGERSPTINYWALALTTGVLLHEWMHAFPIYMDDVFDRDPYTQSIVPGSAYGWENCIQKPTGLAIMNADNYLMFMVAAWLGRQKRYIVQHGQFLGGYTLPRDDDVSTDEGTKQLDITDGRLRFYVDISTPGNPAARRA